MKTYSDGLSDAARMLRETAREMRGGLFTSLVSQRDILNLAADAIEKKVKVIEAMEKAG